MLASTSKLIVKSSTVLRRSAIHRQWYNSTAAVTTAAATHSNKSPASNTWLYNSLSFAAPEESEQAYMQSMLPKEYQHLLARHTINDFLHIPIRTLQDVLVSNQPCIVTTITKPHTIIAVNEAWTEVCGFTQEEVHHKSISAILHGPLTNDSVIESTMQRVQENIVNNKESVTPTEDMYIVNYKKDHTSFINHVTISKILLSQDQPNIQFLLGIVHPTTSVPLRMVI